MKANGHSTIWIDLDNSPHVPFFVPIIQELRKRGYSVFITARDCFQVCGLADLFGLPYMRIGKHYGKNRVRKLFGIAIRACQLLPTALRRSPALAVSHGSRAQLSLASLLNIPTVVIADYEFARGWMFVHPTWVMTPEVIATDTINSEKDRVLKYPGIKEDVYVPNFTPDPSIKALLDLQDDNIVVTIRPPASEAHYHNPESDVLFAAVMKYLGDNPKVKIIVLPRSSQQSDYVRQTWDPLFMSGRAVIPGCVVDGLNLIWHSDLVISGGGTMNREAAALKVPVYSIFRGTIGAVDQYLESIGRLTLVQNISDIKTKIVLGRRSRPEAPKGTDSPALHRIVDNIIFAMESRCS